MTLAMLQYWPIATMRFVNATTTQPKWTFETCQELMIRENWTPSVFTARLANAKMDNKLKIADGFQVALLTMVAELKHDLEVRHHAISMIVNMDDPKHYDLEHFVEEALELQGVHCNDATGKVELLTLKGWLNTSLCREKMAIFIGVERAGKSELQHAIARQICKRSFSKSNGIAQKPTYYYSSALDPLGVLTKEGSMATCSSIHIKDSDLSVLQNFKLTREELKDVTYTKEAATHRARYHSAVWPAGAVRTASWNTGRNPDGAVDWNFNLWKWGWARSRFLLP